MGINNPIPRSLAKEAKKGAKILASFIKPNQFFGADSVIPPEILAHAKGLAIITVLKAGFLFSGRAGSGIIVARLPDGSWSAPSAIVTAGAGVGGQIGAELTDFVFILNTRAAVESFSQAGSITLGGNVSLAAGPIGRNAEAAGSASLKSVAAVFSYAKTKGLFAGVSLEGSVLIERRDANRAFYGGNCTAKQILSGRVDPPPACDPLFMVLESRAFQGRRSEYDDFNDEFYDDIPDEFSDSSSGGRGSRRSSRRNRDYDEYDDNNNNGSGAAYESDLYEPSSHDSRTQRSALGREASWEDDVYDRPQQARGNNSSRRVRRNNADDNDDFGSNSARRQFRSTYSDNPGRPAAPKPDYGLQSPRQGSNSRNSNNRHNDDYDDDAPRRYDTERRMDREREVLRRQEAESQQGGVKAVALYTFDGEQDGDLPFKKGDVLTIVKKSESTDDWWTGRIAGKEGIFPANYVELV
ncbi:protein Ysc84p [Trichomonascus vanleenenianus]|uniref:protein Ysc84p n=1 Tax=Trichomonascus vanleenenianus TaxID=2268995 RepID=UPI003ECB094D